MNIDDIALRLHPADNVAFVKQPLKPGTELLMGALLLKINALIPARHKLAISAIPKGQAVLKYGQVIGFATTDIHPGDHVHVQNLGMQDFSRDARVGRSSQPIEYYGPEQMRYFQGYLRPDGRVGTRNYLAVISTVNCSASVARNVAERFRATELKRDFPGVDGVIAFTHKGGCAIPFDDSLRVLQRVLAGFARHPNISGLVMIGLGCEVNQLPFLVRDYKLDKQNSGTSAPSFLTIQQVGGVNKTVDAGARAIQQLLPMADALRRTPQPINRLILAENCGGSDPLSGITANPALGIAADELVRYGGTPVFAETPEIYGAEHLLCERMASAMAEKLLQKIHWWEAHAKMHHASLDNNPSYGNRESGLTTIYEKSLGAICKGGHSPIVAVYDYAEEIKGPGLCFMDTPGYDPVSMTGLVAGGCNIGVFTTGLGSVYGCKPAPCIKVTTNTAIYNHMIDDMDLNAGTIIDGTETVEQVGKRIFEKIIAVASGEKTKSELAGIGDEEFAPWMPGPTF